MGWTLRGLVALLLVVGVAAMPPSARAAASSCAPLDRAALLKPAWLRVLFLRLAFAGYSDQPAAGTIRKWREPLVVAPFATPPWFDAVFGELAHTIKCATGLDVGRERPGGPRANVTISFDEVPRRKMPADLAATTERVGLMYEAGSIAVSYAAKGTSRIRYASAGIDPELSEARRKTRLLRQMVQILGLGASQDLVDKSVLREGGPTFDALQPNDQVLLRILYDPRLAIGMSRTEAEARLDAVIADAIREMTTPH